MRARHLKGQAKHVFGISAETVECCHQHGSRVDLLGQMQYIAAAQPR
jgi:hypothetical protein